MPLHRPSQNYPSHCRHMPHHQPGATNLFKILDKAGKFKILIRLLKSSQVGDRINTQVNKLKEGLTIFAPTDSAFSSLKAGILNSLSDRDQVELMLFHVLPTFLPTSQFQTVSNPLRTQAGDTSKDQFPLYVTTSGDKVNVSTGIVSATVADTVYSDNRLAVYQVDKVLLPVNIFKSAQLALAPAPAAAATAADSTPDRESPASNDDLER
ncbi:hypothetical protein L1049_014299 [Liquidambar formosana]|uniref:FAS1 domain-containing protein n=1 Tax=Liquidambar formosana TaxID=63359 RepID=A0AAP0RM12_LIQFO